jgi:RNA polymerase sigma-70 factor (ECF subfamily)
MTRPSIVDGNVRTSLIVRLRDGQGGPTDWDAFARFYGPILYRFARKLGVKHQDAGDVSQEVLLKVFQHIGKYKHEPSTSSFQGWLLRCAANAVIDNLRGKKGKEGGGGTSFLDMMRNVPSPAVGPEQEEAARAQLMEEALPDLLAAAAEAAVGAYGTPIVAQAQASVATKSWQAFLLCELARFRAKEVAPFLGMGPASVHRAVSRVRRRIEQTGA